MDTGLPETSVQVEHRTRTPPQAEHIPPACHHGLLYLFVFVSRLGSKGPCSGDLCTKVLASGQTPTETLLELGDV